MSSGSSDLSYLHMAPKLPFIALTTQPSQDTNACNKPTDVSLYGYSSDCQCSCHGYWKNTVVADINNDGQDDMFIRSSSRNEIFLGDGAGGFSEVSHSFGHYSNFGSVPWLLIQDFNNDGYTDLFHYDAAVTGKFFFGSAQGFVELNNAADEVSILSPSGSAGAEPSSVLALDYDRDNYTDILVTWAVFGG